MDSLDTAAPYVPRRAYRRLDEAMIGGVAAGLAEHLNLPVNAVRIGFAAASLVGGFGVMMYVGLWIALRARRTEAEAPGLDAGTRLGTRPRRSAWVDSGITVAVIAVGAGVALLVGAATGYTQLVWAAVIGGVGLILIWRQADAAQRARWGNDASGRRSLMGDGWMGVGRVALGLALLASAVLLTAAGRGLVLDRGVLTALALGMLGVALVLGPWLYRLWADLRDERSERIRSQERADVAAHLHDSVLQTLALIQRSSTDPTRVSALARAQERDLRAWLFESERDATTSLAEALRETAAAIEDRFGVPVEVVAVGDAPASDSGRALIGAAGEAITNAAKHSGAGKVDVYAEFGESRCELFVRDRGRGFDPDDVEDDRRGIRSSIVERMARHGGHAEIRSSAESGTEVRLTLGGES